jgi:hypothetical protein
MKNNGFDYSYRDIAPPKDGLGYPYKETKPNSGLTVTIAGFHLKHLLAGQNETRIITVVAPVLQQQKSYASLNRVLYAAQKCY